MAEKPQPRGFDVNQPGADRETGIGLFRGLTTDIPGGIVDFMSFITGGAKSAAESARQLLWKSGYGEPVFVISGFVGRPC